MSTHSPPKDLNATSLGYKLKQAQHLLRIHMDNALRPMALTTPQYAVLSQLESQPGISNANLARASFITAQTMHGIVSNLEKNKLLKRRYDPHHGRIICIKLTKQGLALVKQAHALVNTAEKNMTHSMNQKNTELLEKLLIECIDNLKTIQSADDIKSS